MKNAAKSNIVYSLLHIQQLQTQHMTLAAAAAAKSLQPCPTLCDPIDGSPPGSPAPGILQARILEWVAISFFNAWKWKVKVKSLSRVRPHGLQPTRLLHPWDFPGKSTRVGCHRLLRILPQYRSNYFLCFSVPFIHVPHSLATLDSCVPWNLSYAITWICS